MGRKPGPLKGMAYKVHSISHSLLSTAEKWKLSDGCNYKSEGAGGVAQQVGGGLVVAGGVEHQVGRGGLVVQGGGLWQGRLGPMWRARAG